jgi:hypothetical protein
MKTDPVERAVRLFHRDQQRRALEAEGLMPGSRKSDREEAKDLAIELADAAWYNAPDGGTAWGWADGYLCAWLSLPTWKRWFWTAMPATRRR